MSSPRTRLQQKASAEAALEVRNCGSRAVKGTQSWDCRGRPASPDRTHGERPRRGGGTDPARSHFRRNRAPAPMPARGARSSPPASRGFSDVIATTVALPTAARPKAAASVETPKPRLMRTTLASPTRRPWSTAFLVTGAGQDHERRTTPRSRPHGATAERPASPFSQWSLGR